MLLEHSLKTTRKSSVGLVLRQIVKHKLCAPEYVNAPIIIGIGLHNQADTLARALISAISQTVVIERKARIIIVDDQSTDNWQSCCAELLSHPSVTVISAFCGSPARMRNQILDYAATSKAKWVARLDADDAFDNLKSVESLWVKGEAKQVDFVLGSNRLILDGKTLPQINIADPELLLNPHKLVAFIDDFCRGKVSNELPSCNLLISTKVTERYPNIRSAEDHWFVTRLLLLPRFTGEVVSYPCYAIYTLGGTDTQSNKKKDLWKEQRQRLAYVAKQWLLAIEPNDDYLGSGQEGIVIQNGNKIEKQFYPWAINDEHVAWLKQALPNNSLVPQVEWRKHQECWSYSTPDLGSTELKLPLSSVVIGQFLQGMYTAGICGMNIKRDNIRQLPDGSLHYIDIGSDIQPLTSSKFLDMAARLYAIAILQLPDEELVRRESCIAQDKTLQQLTGFSDFYLALIEALHPHVHLVNTQALTGFKACHDKETTLLIKACAQDAEILFSQVSHIVTQLNYPLRFKRVILLLDSYRGPFLRQFHPGNFNTLNLAANTLLREQLIDEILVAPTCKSQIQETYSQWFGTSKITLSHTEKLAPLFSQLWAFDQIETRYVLQCDCDVLVGRKDWQHNYLAEMKTELLDPKVISVGFNIPKSTDNFLPYFGQSGEFAPEVRMGLLDLEKVKALQPIANPIANGKYTLTWHRALQARQQLDDLCSLRGGDPNAFYIHPRNEDKAFIDFAVVRDCIAQGLYPNTQQEQFDLVANADWRYPPRNEPVIFLVKGRYTAIEKLVRCLDSLRAQTLQSFGIVLIDDASGYVNNWHYPLVLGSLKSKTTLIRREKHQGRIPNFVYAISEICTNDDSMIVILDQDDCLMRKDVVQNIYNAANQGADLVHMPMFRPNKPLKLYKPEYTEVRYKGGGNVWAHQRAFKKSLFDKVPLTYFKNGNEWISSVTDYATMLPMTELAKVPMFVDQGYTYFHQRGEYPKALKVEQVKLLEEIFAKAPLDT